MSDIKKFKPNNERDYFAASYDYIVTSLALAFRLDILSIPFVFLLVFNPINLFIYFFYLFICVVPLLVLKSYLGQFSTSGFISAFRLSVAFKSIGFINILLNIISLAYYTLFASVSMLYFVKTFGKGRSSSATSKPRIFPWTCEGLSQLDINFNDTTNHAILQLTGCPQFNDTDNPILSNATATTIPVIPSTLYLRSQFGSLQNLFEMNNPNFICWQLVGYSFLVWMLIALIVNRSAGKVFSLIIRYMMLATIILWLFCFVRLLFVPNVLNNIANYFLSGADWPSSIIGPGILALSTFGAGWGSMITLGSFNKFNVNITRYGWFIALGQFVIFLLYHLTSHLMEKHFFANYGSGTYSYRSDIEYNWILILVGGSFWQEVSYPVIWTPPYYNSLFLMALIPMCIQVKSTLTSIFDEYVILREYQEFVSFGFFGLCCTLSFYFCTYSGITSYSVLVLDCFVAQIALNLLLILAILWVYGRERFQRDIEFMLGQQFPTWRVYLIRFITPIFLILLLCVFVYLAYIEHNVMSTIIINIETIVFIILPWLIVPLYYLYFSAGAEGSCVQRIKKFLRPGDWTPVEAEVSERYNEIIANLNGEHHLNNWPKHQY